MKNTQFRPQMEKQVLLILPNGRTLAFLDVGTAHLSIRKPEDYDEARRSASKWYIGPYFSNFRAEIEIESERIVEIRGGIGGYKRWKEKERRKKLKSGRK